MGSNPSTVYWMGMTFFTLICCKNCIVCLKRPKINEKEAGVAHFFKKRLTKREYFLTFLFSHTLVYILVSVSMSFDIQSTIVVT